MRRSKDAPLTTDEIAEVDRFWRHEKRHLVEAARAALPWIGGVEAREALAQTVENERRRKGFLTKAVFDEVLKWGFGRASNLRETDIRAATAEAFSLIAAGDETGAVKQLCKLPGVGVSRASKILALADQRNFGIYDSQAAAALGSIKIADRPLIAVPPGRSKKLRGAPSASPQRLAREHPKYTAVLRRLQANAKRDSRYADAFERVADVERALFVSQRDQKKRPSTDVPGSPDAPLGGVSAAGHGTIAGAAKAAVSGAMPGAVFESGRLLRREVTASEFGKHRARDAGLAGSAHVLTRLAGRVGRANTVAGARGLAASRAVGVSVAVSALADSGALARGDMTLRDFLENRSLDAADAGGNYLVASLVVAALVAAPVEVPALATTAAVVVVGAAASQVVRPARRRVARKQQARKQTEKPRTTKSSAEPRSHRNIRRREQDSASKRGSAHASAGRKPGSAPGSDRPHRPAAKRQA